MNGGFPFAPEEPVPDALRSRLLASPVFWSPTVEFRDGVAILDGKEIKEEDVLRASLTVMVRNPQGEERPTVMEMEGPKVIRISMGGRQIWP